MALNRLPIFSSSDWLQQLLDYAVEHQACVRWGCSTCGAMPFLNAVEQSARLRPGGRNVVDELIGQLSEVPAGQGRQFDGAIRFLIMVIYSGRYGSISVEGLARRLGCSYAAEILEKMQRHAERVESERHECEGRNSPEAVAARREAKRSERVARQQVRLAAKAAREASPAWQEAFGHLRQDKAR